MNSKKEDFSRKIWIQLMKSCLLFALQQYNLPSRVLQQVAEAVGGSCTQQQPLQCSQVTDAATDQPDKRFILLASLPWNNSVISMVSCKMGNLTILQSSHSDYSFH